MGLHALVELPRVPATHEISGTAFDASTRTLYAILDKRPTITSLVASPDFRTWRVGASLDLTGYPEDGWDGEGLVRNEDGSFYVVASEGIPFVGRFDVHGALVEKVNMPSHYADQRSNKGLESLALSPDAHFLFTANEEALFRDGPRATRTRGTLVRIFRRELAMSTDEEFAYRTEPLPDVDKGEMGVSELAALSSEELLVLERGYRPGYGNTVRVFRVRLAGAKNVLNLPSLDDATPVLDKALVVDVGAIRCAGAKHPGPQPNPILENYEGMSLGPALEDGRRLLFLTSDDNAHAS
ncbi:MAG TPA: esterase-like activity of phytase family protein, partial [Polyangiaceae bacterium]|nr:esterase-like activity of phytase family protein [Polyangiaceae bacterium]